MDKKTIDILNQLVENFTEFEKDYAILKEFTDEELAEELVRRTSLGKELE